jgi:hypothetical protein
MPDIPLACRRADAGSLNLQRQLHAYLAAELPLDEILQSLGNLQIRWR